MQIRDLSNVLMHITVMEFKLLNWLPVKRPSAVLIQPTAPSLRGCPTKDNIRNSQGLVLE